MKKRLLLLSASLLIGVGLLTAQTKTVTGMVVEEDGQPVIGASVLVKGTTIGGLTDIDGKFNLSGVPASATTLQIHYIGLHPQEVTIRPNVRVVMKPDTKVLDEVIVVAYGTAKKSAFTGSASVMKADEIAKVQTTNVVNALDGRVSGVQMHTESGQPGITTPEIRIRGISSINAKNKPLIILDGIPYDGDLNLLSNQDVESMTVLKDAASNALYGSRGANGVIMITTKKGNVGAAKVTFDAKWGSNHRATRRYKNIDSPGQYYEMYFSALNNYFANAQGMSSNDAYAMANKYLTSGTSWGLGYNVYSVPDGENLIGTNGKLNPNARLGNIITYNDQEYLITPDDWLKEAYKTSLRQEYNLSISAGSDKGNFFLSFGYLGNDGIIDNSDYKRFTGRMNADYQVKPWLKVGANTGFTHYKVNSMSVREDGSPGSSGNIFAFTTRVAPIYPLYIRDGNGKQMYDKDGIRMYDYGDGDATGLKRPFLGNSNAISAQQLDADGSDGNSFNGSMFAEIRFLDNFKFITTNSVYVNEERTTSYTNPYYGQYANSNGMLYKYHTRDYSFNFQQLLNYTQSFGRHNVSGMVGHEYYRNRYYYLYANKTNMFDPNNHELAGAVNNGSMSSYKVDYNTEGYFTRAMYDYDEKYFVSASYRRDASSRFHKDNRWGNFWSAGVAWAISKEEWFNIPWVDMLKIKASYGSQGNDNIGENRYINTYDIVNSGGYPAAVPKVMGNKDITWETNGNFNTGFDFELLGGRLGGTIEYFYRKTTDMLSKFMLPPSYGYTYYWDNVGDMRNKGFEYEITGTPVKTRDFTWDVRANLTHYRNKITKIADENKVMTTPEGTSGYVDKDRFYGEGKAIYTFFMQKYAGVSEKGEALYYREEADGTRSTTAVHSDATKYLCGTALPDAYGGFGTTLTYKGFDFSIDFAFQCGGKVYDSDYAGGMGTPEGGSKGGAFHADLLKSWTPENTSSNIPRFQFGDDYTNSMSDRFLTSATYLSLQNINAGYTFPTHICREMRIESLRLYLSCDNVALWSRRRGLDPRQTAYGASTSSFYAPIRTVSGGITVTF